MFAILVEIGTVKHTAEFLSGNVLDGKLPFLKGDLDHFKDPSLVVKFLKFQRDYLAPLWGDGSSSHKILAANAILPFTKEEFLSEGNFGKAFIVTFKATPTSALLSVLTVMYVIVQSLVSVRLTGEANVFFSHVKDVRIVRKELINYLTNTADPGKPGSDGSNKKNAPRFQKGNESIEASSAYQESSNRENPRFVRVQRSIQPALPPCGYGSG